MTTILNNQRSLSVVIPFYNETENVEPLIQEIIVALATMTNYEIVAVDDGSKDGTYEKLLDLSKQYSVVRVIHHKTNYGQSAGVVTGVKHAKNDWIATLDGDGQNDPHDIPKLLASIPADYQSGTPIIVMGHRNKRQDNWLRLVSTKIANGVRKRLLQDDCPDTGCGIKLFNRDAFLMLPHFKHVHRFLPALFKRANGIVINIPVNHRPRMCGQSKYGVMNRLWVGIVDIFGVAWLQRRPCRPEIDNASL